MRSNGILCVKSQKLLQREQEECWGAGFKFQQLSTLLRLRDELAMVIGGGRAYNDLAENEHASWL